MTPLAAVVLAAGASTRMGRPKALIQWRGRPFVDHVVGLAQAAGCTPLLVVTGAVPLSADGAQRVHNEAWSRGQMSSVQVGARAVPAGSAMMLLTVDRPHVRPDTVVALARAWRGEPGCVWQPRHDERRGHPIIVPAGVVQNIVAAPLDATLRDVLKAPGVASRRRELSCDDPAVLQNLDRPEDLARLDDVVCSDST